MRIKTDEKILNSIKQRLIRKLNLSPEYINRMNRGSVALYIEDIYDKSQALMKSRANEIVIDKKFVDFDSKGNVIRLKPHLSKLITSQLGHELLHAASRNNGNNGIKRRNGPDNTGLNEGITQMFTEDAFDYVVSPFTDGYTDYKKVAKIMRLCLGNQVFRNSYFDHTDDLERATNRLAQSSTFYAELNQALTDLYYFKKTAKKASPSDKSKIITVYNARIKACLGNVIIYLVVPKINSLKTEEEKKKFINQVLSEVSDNREIFAEVQHLLKSELFMSPEELKKEKEKIKLFDSRAQVKAKIIDLARSDSLDKEAFIIDHDGTMKFKKEDGTLVDLTTDENICSMVYNILFESSGFTFSKQFDMESYVESTLKNSSSIKFGDKVSTKYKMIFLARFKLIASNKGKIVLNSFQEVVNNKELKIVYIEEKMTLKCLRTLIERYEYRPSNKNNPNSKMIVVERNTDKIIKDDRIVTGVVAAYIWLSTYQHSYPGEKIPGLDDAFSPTNQKLYDELIQILVNNIDKKGNMDIPSLYAYANKHKNSRMLKIVHAILKNPETYERMYKFILLRFEERPLQVQKEKSTMEEHHSGYNAAMIDLAVDDIFAKPKR